jgi:hypothetical protein
MPRADEGRKSVSLSLFMLTATAFEPLTGEDLA